MRVLNATETLQELARLLERPCMMLEFHEPDPPIEDVWGEVLKAAPYLEPHHAQFWIDGRAYLVFDTVEERDRHFDLTVGDDGPTKLNPYDGPLRILALPCNADGELMMANT